MPQARKTEDEEPFYYVQLIDLEGGKIRFGPFTAKDFDHSAGIDAEPERSTPQQMAETLRDEIRQEGLVSMLKSFDLWGGLEIRLKGDNGTDILLGEVPSS